MSFCAKTKILWDNVGCTFSRFHFIFTVSKFLCHFCLFEFGNNQNNIYLFLQTLLRIIAEKCVILSFFLSLVVGSVRIFCKTTISFSENTFSSNQQNRQQKTKQWPHAARLNRVNCVGHIICPFCENIRHCKNLL
jgi:hypothetical protein